MSPDPLPGRLPERERYPMILSTAQAKEMLGAISLRELREHARLHPSLVGAKWHGRVLRWDRDALIRWWKTRLPGSDIRASFPSRRGRRSA
ncbi:MAG: hypothetical protein QJR03_15080 [Sphaerobacter sp.]|nr:hypothetical protein [Sphaerobacter sp.]